MSNDFVKRAEKALKDAWEYGCDIYIGLPDGRTLFMSPDGSTDPFWKSSCTEWEESNPGTDNVDDRIVILKPPFRVNYVDGGYHADRDESWEES